MPVILLLPVAASLCFVAGQQVSGHGRRMWRVLGAVLLGLWLWYIVALIATDLPD